MLLNELWFDYHTTEALARKQSVFVSYNQRALYVYEKEERLQLPGSPSYWCVGSPFESTTTEGCLGHRHQLLVLARASE